MNRTPEEILESIQALKNIIENYDLVIYVSGTNPKVVSNFGRAKKIDLEKKMVDFDRQYVVKKSLGDDAGPANYLSTIVNLGECIFAIAEEWSKEEGSWQKYKMDEFEGKKWSELSDYLESQKPLNKIKNYAKKILGIFKRK